MRTILVALFIALAGCANVPVCSHGGAFPICADGCLALCVVNDEVVDFALCDSDGVPCGWVPDSVAVCDCEE